MRVIEQYFDVVLCIILCTMALIFKRSDETLVHDHSNGCYERELIFSAVCFYIKNCASLFVQVSVCAHSLVGDSESVYRQ